MPEGKENEQGKEGIKGSDTSNTDSDLKLTDETRKALKEIDDKEAAKLLGKEEKKGKEKEKEKEKENDDVVALKEKLANVEEENAKLLERNKNQESHYQKRENQFGNQLQELEEKIDKLQKGDPKPDTEFSKQRVEVNDKIDELQAKLDDTSLSQSDISNLNRQIIRLDDQLKEIDKAEKDSLTKISDSKVEELASQKLNEAVFKMVSKDLERDGKTLTSEYSEQLIERMNNDKLHSVVAAHYAFKTDELTGKVSKLEEEITTHVDYKNQVHEILGARKEALDKGKGGDEIVLNDVSGKEKSSDADADKGTLGGFTTLDQRTKAFLDSGGLDRYNQD